jgi:chitinase
LQFAALKAELGDSFAFPPKRILTTTFLPSAWVDDKLIAERTTGLTAYLDHVLSGEITPAVAAFIAPSTGVATGGAFHAEDALPSTMSRKDATALASSGGVEAAAQTFVAGSYYPDWAVDTNPPENIDYSRFDILFFGLSLHISVFFVPLILAQPS